MNIILTLSVDDVNLILNALANRPYVEVAEVIAKIKTDGERQIAEHNKEVDRGV